MTENFTSVKLKYSSLAMSSAKEKQAKRRTKLKENSELYNTYLEKDRQRKAVQRSVSMSSMCNLECEEHKMKERYE